MRAALARLGWGAWGEKRFWTWLDAGRAAVLGAACVVGAAQATAADAKPFATPRCATQSQSQSQSQSQFQVLEQVLPGVWVWPRKWPAADGAASPVALGTTTVVLGWGQRVTVIDPGPHAHAGQALRSQLRCMGWPRVYATFNTHAHPEQVLANAAMRSPVWATARTAQVMRERCAACLHGLRRTLGAQATAGTVLAWPTRVLRHGQWVQAGGRRWQVHEALQAHTASDLVLWSPRQRIALVGGLVDAHAPNARTGSSALGWLRALAHLQALRPLVLVGQHVRARGAAQVASALAAQRQRVCADVTQVWHALAQGQAQAAPEQAHLAWLWPEIEALWMAQHAPPAACDSMPEVGG